MKKLSIIVPVYNEKDTIEEILRRIYDVSLTDFTKEVVVIDDCSNDGTEKILKKLKSKYDYLLIRHKENRGKGGAVRTGLKEVTGDYVLIQDADLEYNPKNYTTLLKAIDFKDLVVYGSRNLGETKRGYFAYYLGGKSLTVLLNILYGAKLTDINTGYKLFPRHVIKKINLECNSFDMCQEITAKTLRLGYEIKEVPIEYVPRKFEEGKKIRFKDGVIGVWTIIKYRFK